jgi:hypothetical protein
LATTKKFFVIFVDQSVGAAIAMFKQGTQKERPLTHDLLANILAKNAQRSKMVKFCPGLRQWVIRRFDQGPIPEVRIVITRRKRIDVDCDSVCSKSNAPIRWTFGHSLQINPSYTFRPGLLWLITLGIAIPSTSFTPYASPPDASRGFGVESRRFHAEGDQTFTVLERWAFLAVVKKSGKPPAQFVHGVRFQGVHQPFEARHVVKHLT